jgi:hypothetical protein
MLTKESLSKVSAPSELPTGKYLAMGQPDLDFYNKYPRVIRWVADSVEFEAKLTSAECHKMVSERQYRVVGAGQEMHFPANQIAQQLAAMIAAGAEVVQFTTDDVLYLG